MAKINPTNKDCEDRNSISKKIGLTNILVASFFLVSLIAYAGLFSGIYDLGFTDLTATMPYLAKYLVPISLISSLLAGMALAKSNSLNVTANNNVQDALGMDIEKKLAGIEIRVEKFLGENYQKLLDENAQFKKDFEAVQENLRENENKRYIDDIENLKVENEGLRGQLKKLNEPKANLDLNNDRLQLA